MNYQYLDVDRKNSSNLGIEYFIQQYEYDLRFHPGFDQIILTFDIAYNINFDCEWLLV